MLAQLVHELEAVHLRHHQVEEDHTGPRPGPTVQAGAAVPGIITSSVIASGRNSRAMLRPSSPPRAEYTRNPSLASDRCSKSCTRASSSITSTVPAFSPATGTATGFTGSFGSGTRAGSLT